MYIYVYILHDICDVSKRPLVEFSCEGIVYKCYDVAKIEEKSKISHKIRMEKNSLLQCKKLNTKKKNNTEVLTVLDGSGLYEHIYLLISISQAARILPHI